MGTTYQQVITIYLCKVESSKVLVACLLHQIVMGTFTKPSIDVPKIKEIQYRASTESCGKFEIEVLSHRKKQ